MPNKLSQRQADMVVTEINRIIKGKKLNVMNPNGIIIASTDQERIGTFHEGAKKIVDEHLDKLLIRKRGEYIGSIPGINYPLTVEGETIGVIGVTGSDEETLTYGKIIKRMTELLVQENLRKEKEETEETIRQRYLNEWISDGTRQNDRAFVEKGMQLGIDVTKPKRIMALDIYIPGEEQTIRDLQTYDAAARYLQQLSTIRKDGIFFAATSFFVYLTDLCDDEAMLETARNLKEMLEMKFPVRLAAGIDEAPEEGHWSAPVSERKAYRALQACLRMHRKDIRLYSGITMEILTSELSENVKEEFLRKIFGRMSPEEIKEAFRILDVYYQVEGSIGKAADLLYIHKNTLQKKLIRIARETGYDPRSIRYSSLFYVAGYLYHDMYGSEPLF